VLISGILYGYIFDGFFTVLNPWNIFDGLGSEKSGVF